MNARILLVEDDPGVQMVVADLLLSEGHEVESIGDGGAGLRRALEGPFDLLILDVMLPAMDGFQICQKVREHGFDGGILFLTARGQLEDRVGGLSTGADDYLVKPFDPGELLARIQALLRRVRRDNLTPVSRIRFGSVEADFVRLEFRRKGQPVELTAKEAELLRFLVNHRGQVQSREKILRQVWREQRHITVRTVDVHIAWLRQKLEEVAGEPRHILTIRGEGYRFQGEA